MSYNPHRRRVSGLQDEDEENATQPEIQGLLDKDDDEDDVDEANDLARPLLTNKPTSFANMGLKDLKARVAFFQGPQERTPLERDLVRRLDIFLMTFGCISQVIKYLDQTNISNAYVSGMKEDLNLYGNELNYFTTYFSVSYCIMLIPSQVIMTWVRPSWWLPGLEIGWGIMTGLIALCKNAHQVYVLRVFLGIFESSAWPGMMSLFMFWYTPTELAKRMGFYHSCQALGSMLSGALQTAILNTVDGAHGIAGWRWLFIINCVMTIVIGVAGFFMLPDYPSRPNPRAAFWFKPAHAEMALERLARHGRAEAKPITWAAARRTATMWVAYFIPLLYIGTVLAQYGYNYFNLFLKSVTLPDGTPRWTTSDVNAIPIGGGAINVVFVWIWAILSDVFQTRWTLLVAQAVIGLVPAITMSVWTRHPDSTPIGAAYASFFLSYMCLGTAPLIMSWLSDLIPQDPEARTLIVGYAIAGVYAIIAWSQVLVWPASEAPYYRYAWQVSIALWIFIIIMVGFLRYMDVKYLLPKRLAAHPMIAQPGKSDEEDATGVDATGQPVNPKRAEVVETAP